MSKHLNFELSFNLVVMNKNLRFKQAKWWTNVTTKLGARLKVQVKIELTVTRSTNSDQSLPSSPLLFDCLFHLAILLQFLVTSEMYIAKYCNCYFI